MKLEDIPILVTLDKEKLINELKNITEDCEDCIYYAPDKELFCSSDDSTCTFEVTDEKITEILGKCITVSDGSGDDDTVAWVKCTDCKHLTNTVKFREDPVFHTIVPIYGKRCKIRNEDMTSNYEADRQCKHYEEKTIKDIFPGLCRQEEDTR